jgi:translation initiation factor IF-2
LAKGKTGIRVNQLAKDLGIESKVILEKFRQEDPPIEVPNHQSTISLGLAETVKDWFNNGELNDLIKLHGTGEAAGKKKKAPARKGASEEDSAGGTATMVAEGDDAPAELPDAIAAPAPEPDPSEPVDVTAPPVEFVATDDKIEELVATGHADPRRLDDADTDVDDLDADAAETTTAPVATPFFVPPTASPAPTAPLTPPPAAPMQPGAGASGVRSAVPIPPSRPTVKLENKSGPAKPERPRVAATPFTPKPATLAGPKLVREEKPDIVSAPRKKLTPLGPQSGGMTNAPSRAGRGVKVTEGEEGEEGDKKAVAKGKPGVVARRRAPDGRRGEADEKLRDFSEQDLKDRADRINSASAMRQATDMHLRKTEARGTHVQARTAAQRGGVLEIEEPINIRSLSTELGVKTNEILGKLMKMGVFANINQALEFDTAALLAMQYNVELQIKKKPTLEDALMGEFDSRVPEAENFQPRPPVVTILGHVDHGKTSLLDRIRSANVAAGEAGGITQHIAAWQVQLGEKRVTFIDTPGHQAFTAMRARGANMTDVVVLVVSAAEGVQPQTIESINHAKAAEVPIIVAMNKIDRADANPDMVLGQLAGAGLNPTEWGGDTEVIRTSATTGQGIQDLIEVLDYQTQLRDLKADATGPARGSVIEARMDPGLGPIATVLVQDGTLKIGDVVLAGQGWGRVRSLLDDKLKHVPQAGPSMPIIISGLSQLPSSGDKFFALEDMDRARSIAEEREAQGRADQQANRQKVTLETVYGQMKESTIKTINLIIKADVQGSVETLQKTVIDQNTEEVRVKVIHAAAGPISESDVELADASDAVIIGFQVVADDAARQLAEQRRVEVRTYRVIYEIFDDLKKALSGMLAPEIREKLHGHVEIRAIFKVSKLGNIAGCFVTDGHVQRGSRLRLSRDGKIITEDLSIESLKRLKDDVREVKAGLECGIKISNYDDLKIGDRLEAYVRETIQRTL